MQWSTKHKDDVPWHARLEQGHRQLTRSFSKNQKFADEDEINAVLKNLPHECGHSRRKHAKKEAEQREALLQSFHKNPGVDEKIKSLFRIAGAMHADGGLQRSEITKLVQIVTEYEGASTEIDLHEIDWILASADVNGSNAIDPDEVRAVVVAIRQWIDARRDVKKYFQLYDFKGQGMLDKDGLQCVLLHLNDSVPVDDADVDAIFNMASHFKKDKLVQPELAEAINYWYNNCHPPKVTMPQVDRQKGGSVGRAMTGLHVEKDKKTKKKHRQDTGTSSSQDGCSRHKDHKHEASPAAPKKVTSSEEDRIIQQAYHALDDDKRFLQ